MDDNHSLDLTNLLARINMRVTLKDGPCAGVEVPMPPLLYGELPEYVCAQRPYDTTHYHYVLVAGDYYAYADHCDTYSTWPHHPWQPELSNKARDRKLFASVGLIIIIASAAVMVGLIIKIAEVLR
jgi:hypothetical protein